MDGKEEAEFCFWVFVDALKACNLVDRVAVVEKAANILDGLAVEALEKVGELEETFKRR